MAWKQLPRWGNLKKWSNDTPWHGNNLPWGKDETETPDLKVVEGGKKTPRKAKKAAAKAEHPTTKTRRKSADKPKAKSE